MHRCGTVVFLLIAYAGGCTDAYVLRIAQSENGSLVAFSDLRWENVWATAGSGFVKCGKAPFCVSPEGNRVVAMRDGSGYQLAVTQIGVTGHKTTLIDLGECMPWNTVIREMRCSSNQIIVHVVGANDRVPAGEPQWIVIDMMSGRCIPGTRAIWDAMPAPIALDESQTTSDSTQIVEYVSRNRTVVLAKTSFNRKNSVELLDANRQSRAIIVEDPFTFFSKRLANAGFQPP